MPRRMPAWDGVPVSPERLTQLHDGLGRAVALHRAVLNKAGLLNPNSSPQALAFLRERGHEDRLMHNGRATTSDEALARIEPLDPMVTHLRRYRSYVRLW